MLNRYSSCGESVTKRYSLLSNPLLGAARSSQAMAPRNGGVTKDAVTSARMVLLRGRSVRATSQPIGAATAQQMIDEPTATVNVVISGAIKAASVKRRSKFAKVKLRVRSVKA